MNNLNLFDTLLEGVYAKYSNFTCFNNAVEYMRPATGYPDNFTGDGIGGKCLPSAPTAPDYDKYRMQLLGNNSDTGNNNVFYECYRAVTSQGYYYINGKNAAINDYGGDHGYYITSPRYYNISVTGSNIWNPGTGISMNTTILSAYTVNQFSGGLNISNNSIWGGYLGIMAKKMISGTGINVDTLVGAIAHVDTNNVNYANSGISISDYQNQQITTDTNYVLLNKFYVGWAYGIEHSDCNGSFIRNNVVLGDSAPAPSISTPYFSAPARQVGIFGTLNTNATVTCNIAANLSTCYQFVGSGNRTFWLNNVMENSNIGMVMQGDFGWQFNPGMLASSNIWKGGTSAWTIPNYTILTLNTDSPSTLSTIFVGPDAGTYVLDPAHNWNQPPILAYMYGYSGGSGNGLFVLPGANIPDCAIRAPLNSSYYRMSHSRNTEDSLLELIVTNPAYSSQPLNWIEQNNLYRMMLKDSSYANNSSILAQFKSMADSSRYGWLAQIENAIATGNMALANSLLSYGIHTYMNTAIDTASGVIMTDDTTADYIVNYYITLYKKYLLYQSASLTGTDSIIVLAIANLCPYMNGNVVFEARTLYRILFQDDTTIFIDTCSVDTTGMSSRQTYNKGLKQSIIQQYKLFPNPNDGTFILQQMVADNNPAHVEIRDILGRSIYSQNVQFALGITQLQLGNLASGIYLLQISDGKGKINNFKFVIK